MSEEVESDMNILQQSAFDIDLNLDPAWCNWFVGWADGEGCFQARPHKSDRAITCEFCVKVRDDDSQLVCGVLDILQCGVINRRHVTPEQSENSGRKDQIEWRCNDFGACRHILIPLFDKYPLRSKKNRDYKIWREIIMLVSEQQHLNGNRDYVLDLCRQLKDIRKYVPPNLVNA